MRIRSNIILFSLLAILLPAISFADYVGPTVIIEGLWGKGDLDFGFEHGDTMDSFPGIIFVDILGNIIIGDSVNSRVKIYSSKGVGLLNFTYKAITVPYGGWPANLRVKAGVGIFSIYEKLQKYDYKGKLIWAIDIPGTRDYWVLKDGSVILQDISKNYIKYSPNGQLLKTYTERPLELGVVKEESLGGRGYRVTIKYPDMTYSLNKGPFQEYIRGCEGSLYAVAFKFVEKFGTSGESVGELTIPEDQHKVIRPAGRGLEQRSEVVEEYGQPVVAPMGDVYTWKRTPDKYSIIKWVWVDGPDAPQMLRAMASSTGIALTWEQPQKDASAVTSYEINRSGDVCGPFRPIGTVKKGVLTYEDQGVKPGETWYYQVRAMRDKTPSGYSNKAIGTR